MSEESKAKVRRFIEDITPGGVALFVVEVPAGYFGFAADPDALPFDVGTFARIITAGR